MGLCIAYALINEIKYLRRRWKEFYSKVILRMEGVGVRN